MTDLPPTDLPPGGWIIIPNWERFQHYRNRNPLWIKVYAKLLHDPDYLGLSLASKGLLQIIWLAYSQTNGQLSLQGLRAIARDSSWGRFQLEALNHAGFIYFAASKPLAAKEETEKEKESPKSPYSRRKLDDREAARELRTRALDFAADWAGGPSESFDDALDALERELHTRLPEGLRSELWDEARKRDKATA